MISGPGLPLIIGLLAIACSQPPVAGSGPDGNSPNGPPAGSSQAQQNDWAAIERLEQEAKALATTAGCTSSADCRAAPVGSRACGGPRYYLPYCARTTDSTALQRKLDEVAAAERAYNQKYNVGSTCEFRMPPEVVASGGSCTAQ